MQVFWQVLRAWLLAWLAAGLAAAQAHTVCVLSSEQGGAFQEAAEALVQEWQRSGQPRSELRLLSLAEYAETGCGADTRLAISLGTEAFRQLSSGAGRSPILAGLLPRSSYERVLQDTPRRPAPPSAALYLDQPLGRQLDLLRLALPHVRRVGLLWGPESLAQQAAVQAALQARGLEWSEGTLVEGQPLIAALRAALQDADVLLAVADGRVYNASSIANILLTSYRAGTPVLAFSPAYVKAGALLALHSTAAQAGVRLANLAGHYLQSGVLPASQYPADFQISANPYVARSLGLVLDPQALGEHLRKPEKRP